MFRRELLPPARAFYEAALGELRRPSRNWAQPKAGCPFHPSKSKKSFSVNLENGAFYCFGCQAKGGDLVSFVMKRDNLNFRDAAKALGAWDGHDHSYKPLPTVPIRFLVFDYVIDGVPHHAEIRDESKNDLQRLRWIFRDAIEHTEQDRENETYWSIAADAWELIAMEIDDAL